MKKRREPGVKNDLPFFTRIFLSWINAHGPQRQWIHCEKQQQHSGLMQQHLSSFRPRECLSKQEEKLNEFNIKIVKSKVKGCI